MSEWDYSWDYGGEQPYDNWSWDAGAMPGGFTPDYSYDYGGQQPYDNWSGSGGAGSLSLEDQVRQAIAARPDLYGSASQAPGWGSSILGALGSVGSFLGKNAGTLGPLLSGAGSIAGGAVGSTAANDAARLQSQALNRGIDLSTSQWLNQLERTQPWVQAGQQAIGTLQGLAGREAPSMASSYPTQVNRQWYDYGVPSATPGWQPQAYQGPQGPNAGDYRWTPQEGPQAADFRYTPGQIPAASQYAYRPGAVPTLSGQELLANDPGVQFRQDEARKALEGSAAARGDLLSGQNLKALQSRSQDLASQEYSNAWNRASQQAQLREQWAQNASQLGWNQAESEARLREQVNQIASQQGWSQSHAEAVFREQQLQLASQQGWNQALQGQQNAFTQGLDTSKWNTLQQQQWAQEQYKNMLTNNQLMYGRDTAENQTNYDREQARYRQQLTQHLLPWEQSSTLASLGAQVTGQLGNQGIASSSGISNLLGQLGATQGMGTLGSAGQWNQAISGGVGSLQNILKGLNA